jgi:AcrR family transcriptional regulator
MAPMNAGSKADKANKPDRGDATRHALLESATRVFARYGYDGASSRTLASEAGVNQALISYHFGGKEGLYLAVFEEMERRLLAQLMPDIAGVLAELESLEAAAAPGTAGAVRCMTRLLHTMVDVFLGQDTADWAKLMLREQQAPSKAFEVIYEGPMKAMLGTMTRLAELAIGDDEQSDARLVALTLISQVMVFRLANAAAVRHLGWQDGIGEEQIRLIKDQIARNVRARFSRGEGHDAMA